MKQGLDDFTAHALISHRTATVFRTFENLVPRASVPLGTKLLLLYIDIFPVVGTYKIDDMI